MKKKLRKKVDAALGREASRLLKKGLADAKAGRIVSAASITPAGKTIVTNVEVEWPPYADFFNDCGDHFQLLVEW